MSDILPRIEKISESERETRIFASRLGDILEGGILIGLDGELGSGKTCFVQGLAHGLGIPPEDVSSPTFVICHVYQGEMTLLHVDAYRLRQIDEFEELAIPESLESGAVVIVEWSERVTAALPADRLQVQIDELSPKRRRITISAGGEFSRKVLAKW